MHISASDFLSNMILVATCNLFGNNGVCSCGAANFQIVMLVVRR